MEISLFIFIAYSALIIAISIWTGWLWGQVVRVRELEEMYEKVLDKQRKVIREYERHIKNEGDGWKFGLK